MASPKIFAMGDVGARQKQPYVQKRPNNTAVLAVQSLIKINRNSKITKIKHCIIFHCEYVHNHLTATVHFSSYCIIEHTIELVVDKH